LTGNEPEVTGGEISIKGTFGKRLRELREDRNLSRTEMASILNIPKATYANWEQCRALPSLEQIPFLADFFGVSADYLLGISKQQAVERLVERMSNLPENSQKIVMALIDEILAMK